MSRGWKIRLALVAVIGVVAGLLVASGPSGAAFVNGQLWIRGHGSKYASSNSSGAATAVGTVGTPGHAVSYDVRVVNTGTSSSQFLVFGSTGGGSTVSFAAGKTDVTADVTGAGYTTPEIAAGGSLAMTMKVTLDAAAPQGTFVESDMWLENIGGSISDQVVSALTPVKAKGKGSGASDVYITQPGGGKTMVGPWGTQSVAGLPLRAGGSESFTVKLQNDGPGSVPVKVQAADLPFTTCNGSFVLTVKQGSRDVTGQVLGSGYTTPALAHGRSQVLKFTFSYPTAVAGCFEEYYRASVTPADFTPGSLITFALPTAIN